MCQPYSYLITTRPIGMIGIKQNIYEGVVVVPAIAAYFVASTLPFINLSSNFPGYL